ncbi:vitamin B12 dependent-methionine synthase activation domain-containing protein, partial [Shewanella sp. TB7-MNA-CIBAN-0143]
VKVREQQARKKPRSKPVTIQRARDNAAKLDWDNYTPPVPKKLGVIEFKNVSIATLRKYIDWTPYFMTWSIAGKYPRIMTDEVVGEQAQS